MCGGQGAVKKKVESDPNLEENLNSILEVRTAGEPDEPEAKWTDLSPRQIASTSCNCRRSVRSGSIALGMSPWSTIKAWCFGERFHDAANETFPPRHQAKGLRTSTPFRGAWLRRRK